MLDLYAIAESPALPTTASPGWGRPLYFASSVGGLLAHPAGYVRLRLHAGPHPVDYVQAFLTHSRHLLGQRGWQLLLADERGMNPFSATEQAWIVDYWLARQHRESHSGHSQGAGLTYHGFPEPAAALAWLGQPAAPGAGCRKERLLDSAANGSRPPVRAASARP